MIKTFPRSSDRHTLRAVGVVKEGVGVVKVGGSAVESPLSLGVGVVKVGGSAVESSLSLGVGVVKVGGSAVESSIHRFALMMSTSLKRFPLSTSLLHRRAFFCGLI